MNRAILAAAALPAAALAELKQWLGISTGADDAPLEALLAAAVEACEGFTGLLPLASACEEIVSPADGAWIALATRPVFAITAVAALAADGTRTPLAPGTWEPDLDADGTGRLRIARPEAARRFAVQFSAGLAQDWDALAPGLRHGIVRLAAHQHRERESEGAAPLPPASVAALWRPWRRVRLA